MDKKYESTYQRRDYTKDPNYNPLQVADRAAATQQVINSRERQESLNKQSEQLYQTSYMDRLETEGANQIAQAKELSELGKLSQSLAGELTKMEAARGEAAALDQSQIRYEQGLSEERMKLYGNREAELAGEGAAIDTAAHQLGEETGLASVERSGRQLSGWRAYGNKVGEARLLGENYGTAAKASKESFSIPNPNDPDGPPLTLASADTRAEYGLVLQAFRREYFKKSLDYSPELKEKYMYESMRKSEAEMWGEWEENQRIKLEEEKKGYMASELRQAVTADNPQVLVDTALQIIATQENSYKGGVKGFNDAFVQTLTSLDLSTDQINLLWKQKIPGSKQTFGDRFGRGIKGGRTGLLSAMSTRQEADINRRRQEQERGSKELALSLREEQKNGTFRKKEDVLQIVKDNNLLLTPDLLKVIQNEPVDIKTARAKADSLYLYRGGDDGGFLRRAEYDALPIEIRAEYKDKLIGDPSSKENKTRLKNLDNQVKILVVAATQAQQGDDGSIKDTVAKETYDKATEWYASEYAQRRRDNPEKTAQQIYDELLLEARNEFNPDTWGDKGVPNPYASGGAKSTMGVSASENVKVRNVGEYLERNPFGIASLLPGMGSADDPKSSLGRLVAWDEAGGKGEGGTYIPNEYYRIASMVPDMDVYDVINAQLRAANITPQFEKPPKAAYVDTQPADVQKLLKNLPTPSRGLRAAMGGNSGLAKDPKEFLDLIASVESKGYGDYDAMNTPGDNLPYNSNERLQSPLSGMTIREVLQLQEDGQVHAAGRYQFTNHQGAGMDSGTLAETVRLAGMSLDDAFSPENQDRLALARARWRINQGTGMTGLRNEWVGLNAVPNMVLQPFTRMFDKVDTSSPYNQPEMLTPGVMKAVYTTGNIGPTSTGPHLDVKQVGGGRFAEDELDNYVVVDDPEYGQIGLGELRRRTGGVGDNYDQHVARGSHGIDYGTHSGTKVSLKNGAKVVSSQPSPHGDILTIELPDGRQFTFLHGTSI